jgi:transposase
MHFSNASGKQALEAGRRVVVIIDNAKYHHAKLHADWRSQDSTNVMLHFLPPYSPDLNSIERLWKLTRRLCLHNRYFPTLEDVVQSVNPNSSDGHRAMKPSENYAQSFSAPCISPNQGLVEIDTNIDYGG